MSSCYNSYKNTFLATLPIEILDFIWSLNYLWASNIIQKRTKRFIRYKINEINNMITFAHSKCNLCPTMNNYNIFFRNKILTKKDILNTCIACKCCEKHQLNKPKKLKLWEETEFHFTQHIDCPCTCRHLSRWMCRHIS